MAAAIRLFISVRAGAITTLNGDGFNDGVPVRSLCVSMAPAPHRASIMHGTFGTGSIKGRRCWRMVVNDDPAAGRI
jgi:hypothetical protein